MRTLCAVAVSGGMTHAIASANCLHFMPEPAIYEDRPALLMEDLKSQE